MKEKQYFSQYWKNDTYEINRKNQGKPFEHTAGNDLLTRGIGEGDIIFAVTVIKGRLFLIGAMEVDGQPRTEAEARSELQERAEAAARPELQDQAEQLWPADVHLLAQRRTLLDFERPIPFNETRQLMFFKKGKLAQLVFVDNNKLDRQTLRGIREMPEETAQILLDLHSSRLEHFSKYPRRKRAGR